MKRDKEREKLRWRHTLRWRLTLFVFSMMVCSGILTVSVYAALLFLFPRTPFLIALTLNPLFLFGVLLLISSGFGILLSSVFGVF